MNIDWMLIRGTGLVAFALLAASTIWGLMLSSKVFGRLVKAKPLTWVHEGLAVGSLLATGAHMFFLWTDEFIEFGPRELFVPGASGWEPLSVAFGIMAFYVMVIISASFYVKRWIGQAAWRALHFLAFGTFAAAAVHGVMAGTDTQHPAVLGSYVASIAIVVMLLLVRFSQEIIHAQAQPEPVSGIRESARAGPGTAPPATDAARPTASGTSTEDRLAALRARRTADGSRASIAAAPSGADRKAGTSSETLDRIAALQARRVRAGD